MLRPKPEILLCDLDGVIRHFPRTHSEVLEARFGLPHGTFLSLAFQKQWIDLVVTGKISDASWRKKIASAVATYIPANEAEKAVSLWSDFPGELDREMLDFLGENKQHSKLALLTNATDKLPQDLKTLKIFDFFDLLFNTSEIGFAKPDPRAFHHVLKSLNVDPEKIFFIDDRKENIETALNLGMQAHHFTSVSALRTVSSHWG